jgi:hypothetical protein
MGAFKPYASEQLNEVIPDDDQLNLAWWVQRQKPAEPHRYVRETHRALNPTL